MAGQEQGHRPVGRTGRWRPACRHGPARRRPAAASRPAALAPSSWPRQSVGPAQPGGARPAQVVADDLLVLPHPGPGPGLQQPGQPLVRVGPRSPCRHGLVGGVTDQQVAELVAGLGGQAWPGPSAGTRAAPARAQPLRHLVPGGRRRQFRPRCRSRTPARRRRPAPARRGHGRPAGRGGPRPAPGWSVASLSGQVASHHPGAGLGAAGPPRPAPPAAPR